MTPIKSFYMTKGLPGSGKSTWAREKVLSFNPGVAVRVNQDLLRIMFHMDRFGGKHTEPLVKNGKNTLIDLAMRRGVSVIICDDTNFHPACEKDFRDLCSLHGYSFHIQDFTDVSVEECIKRDLKRLESVGEQVIRKMYRKYLAPVKKPVNPAEFDPSLPTAVMVDIDGTVAIMDGRGPYDASLYHTDIPHEPVVQLVKDLHAAGEKIVFCSGRDDTYWSDTHLWLSNNLDFYPEYLFMRPAADKRKDSIVKKELYEANIKGKFNIRFVLDDRNQVVEMWREEGLTCLQVADGDF